jgi:hypothetical protein
MRESLRGASGRSGVPHRPRGVGPAGEVGIRSDGRAVAGFGGSDRAAAGLSPDEPEDDRADEEHDADDGEPEQALKGEAHDREHSPGNDENPENCPHALIISLIAHKETKSRANNEFYST